MTADTLTRQKRRLPARRAVASGVALAPRVHPRWRLGLATAWALLFLAGRATAEEPPPRPYPLAGLPSAESEPPPLIDDPDGNVTPAGCSACARGLLGLQPPAFPAVPFAAAPGASCNSGCVPGRQGCSACCADTWLGRVGCALYECICCPDPCYEPRWLPIADAAFFVDAARPVSQMRYRWVSVLHLQAPDRAEYFWARADGRGKGPRPRNPARAETSVKYDDLRVYTEGATGAVGVFTEMTYRALDPEVIAHASGFTDMVIGTKTLLFDCELLQIAFQFKTFIPSGNFTKGLGTGHVSLEPSLIFGVKLAPDTFLQAQLAEWIPLGGDPDYMGSILHYHFSFNHVLYRCLPDVPLIGTCELNGWSFQDGAYTDPVRGPFQKAGNDTYLSGGGGLRLVVCDKFDVGFAAAFGFGNRRVPDQEYRIEVRVRY